MRQVRTGDTMVSLRKELLDLWSATVFNPDAVGQVLNRMREELVKGLSDNLKEELEAAFTAGRGVGETAIRLKVPLKIVVEAFKILTDTRPKPYNGDPSGDRSALNGHKSWEPEYDDKPQVAAKQPGRKPEQKFFAKMWKKDIRKTTFPLQEVKINQAVTEAARLFDADPIKVITNARDFELTRAQDYAALALLKAYPKCDKKELARGLGIANTGTQESYASVLLSRKKTGKLRWLDERVVDHIAEMVLKA